MPMILYNANISPFTSRVRLQIRAKGLDNEIQIAPRPAIEDYKQLTPIGKIPCLDTGMGFHLPESETIAEFIEDTFPEPNLRGDTPLNRAKVRLFSRIVDLYHVPAFFEAFALSQAKERDAAKIEDVWGRIDQALAFIETYLEGPVYATQCRLTLADCALIPALFFHTALAPAFGRTPFQGFVKVRDYYNALTVENPLFTRIVEEQADGLRQMMAASAA